MASGTVKTPLGRVAEQDFQRFSELQRALTGAGHKVLAQQLKELERHGILVRTAYAEVPPTVQYSLTALGLSLRLVVDAMHQWGLAYGSQK